jgi:uncharacterized protein YbjT (DUF2867 family)
MQRTALIAGATGLVGSCLLPLLLQGGRYERVVALVRTATGVVHPRLQEVLTNFSRFADLHYYESGAILRMAAQAGEIK